MIDLSEYLDYFVALVGAFIGWFFGDINGFIYALLTFCILDYITGVLAAGVKHELSSSVGFNGIARKVTIFILVGLVNIIDTELLGQFSPFHETALLRNSVIFFYLSNEGISILENAVVIGIPIPEFLKERLLEFKKSKVKPSKK